MFLISHRGNLNGKQKENENNPLYITEALNKGFNVEIDVWNIDGQWLLGHDFPQFRINLSFLHDSRLWCHAKNLQAMSNLVENKIHCFWHESDKTTLTTKNFLWTYPGEQLFHNSICVMPETFDFKNNIEISGICSDFIESYR